MLVHLHIVSGTSYNAMTKLRNCHKDHMVWKAKLSGLSQTKLPNSALCKENIEDSNYGSVSNCDLL